MLEANIKEWDDAKPASENQKKFSWAPGLAFRPKREQQLRDVLASHPRGEEVVAAIKEAHHWFHSGGCVRRGEEPGGGELAGHILFFVTRTSIFPYPSV